jgi:hypothetical protein
MRATKREHHDNAQDARPTRPAAARSAAGFIESEAIAHRAYELFEERGRGEGREFDDCLHTEHELRELNNDNASE